MSIIDPLYTLPLLLFSVLAILFAHRGYHLVALLWMVGYVGFGTVQRERAEDAGLALAIARGHQITDISAKPGFASLRYGKRSTSGMAAILSMDSGWEHARDTSR